MLTRFITHEQQFFVSFSLEGETKAYWLLRQGPWLTNVNTNKNNVCKKNPETFKFHWASFFIKERESVLSY